MEMVQSTLLRLPDELQISVIDQLCDRKDLFNLCLTCRKLEVITSALLHREVEVEILPNHTLAWNLGGVPLLRNDVVSSIKSLGVQNSHANIRHPAYDRSQRYYGSVELLMRDFLQELPGSRLRRLSFLHQSPMTEKVMLPLLEKQADTLVELGMYDLKCFALPATRLPSKLEVFECRTFTDGEQVGGLLYSSRHSLHKFQLGQEKLFVERYSRSRNPYTNQSVEPLEQLTSVLDFRDLISLRELELYGINLLPLLLSTDVNAEFYCCLQKLSLESCHGTSELLESLTHVYASAGDVMRDLDKIEMRDFRLRHEDPDSDFRSSLAAFLGSFGGLESLCLLFENTTILQKPSTLVKCHSKTLKKVVLECRTEPRQFIAHDTSRPFGAGGHTQTLWEESVREICNLCPNLEELGTALPWNDELIRLRQSAFPSLSNLRTLHIRNFPESNTVTQFGDYSIKQFAQRFLDWTFPAVTATNAPSLETLAIGPKLYQSRWKVEYNRGPLPEYLRTHYFCVDWHTNRFGHWLPLLTSVNERYMEKLRAERPLGGMFESIWLK